MSIRSWLSLSMSSYGVMPVSRIGTRSRYIFIPLPLRPAISKLLDVSPAAPISWIPTT